MILRGVLLAALLATSLFSFDACSSKKAPEAASTDNTTTTNANEGAGLHMRRHRDTKSTATQ